MTIDQAQDGDSDIIDVGKNVNAETFNSPVCSTLETKKSADHYISDPCLLHTNLWEKIQQNKLMDDCSEDDDVLLNDQLVDIFLPTDEAEILEEGFTLEDLQHNETVSGANTSSAQLIYDSARINYDDSMLLIKSFCVRHKLSAGAIRDLIQLIFPSLSRHCKNGFQSQRIPLLLSKKAMCDLQQYQVLHMPAIPVKGVLLY